MSLHLWISQLHDIWGILRQTFGQSLVQTALRQEPVDLGPWLWHKTNCRLCTCGCQLSKGMKSACIFGTESFATTDLRHFLHWKELLCQDIAKVASHPTGLGGWLALTGYFSLHGTATLPIQKGLKWLHAWVKRWHLPCTMKRPEESSNVQSLPVEVSGFPSVRTFASASFAVAVVQGTHQFEGTNPKVPQTQTQSHQVDHKLPGLMADDRLPCLNSGIVSPTGAWDVVLGSDEMSALDISTRPGHLWSHGLPQAAGVWRNSCASTALKVESDRITSRLEIAIHVLVSHRPANQSTTTESEKHVLLPCLCWRKPQATRKFHEVTKPSSCKHSVTTFQAKGRGFPSLLTACFITSCGEMIWPWHMTIHGRVNPCSRELDGKVADLRPKTKLDNCKFYADYAVWLEFVNLPFLSN